MMPEKPVENAAMMVTRSQETDQIKTADIIRNAPLTQDFMPLGYNFNGVVNHVARASFWGFGVSLDPNLKEAASKTGKINATEYQRSTTKAYGLNNNQYIWDQIPELENFPVSGYPNQVQQQYVLYNVQPEWLASTQKKLHVHQQAVPTAYNATIPTQKPTSIVLQTPVASLMSRVQGSSLVSKLKSWLVGSAS